MIFRGRHLKPPYSGSGVKGLTLAYVFYYFLNQLPADSSSSLIEDEMPEIWDSSDEEYEHIVNSDCTDAAQDEVSFTPLIHFVVTFLLSWQAIFRV